MDKYKLIADRWKFYELKSSPQNMTVEIVYELTYKHTDIKKYITVKPNKTIEEFWVTGVLKFDTLKDAIDSVDKHWDNLHL